MIIPRRILSPYYLLLLFVLILGGCRTSTVVRGIGQAEANRVVALLAARGIAATAEKDRGGHDAYNVAVKSSAYSEAVTILDAAQIPSDRDRELGAILEPKGLLPSSREIEALRIDRALALEVEEQLLQLPGVGGARVVVRAQSVRDDNGRGVSAVLRMRHGMPAVNSKEVLGILQRAVPGVREERISVSVIEDKKDAQGGTITCGVQNDDGAILSVPLESFFLWRIAEGEYHSLALTILCCLLLIGIVALMIGYWFGQYQGQKTLSERGPLVDGAGRFLRLDVEGRETKRDE